MSTEATPSRFPAREGMRLLCDFTDVSDRELAWETLRTHQDHARAEEALQALDRIYDRCDDAQEMLALCAADTTAVELRQQQAFVEAVLDRFAEINAARENPSQMVTDLIADVRYQYTPQRDPMRGDGHAEPPVAIPGAGEEGSAKQGPEIAGHGATAHGPATEGCSLCWHAAHAPGRCMAHIGTGYAGPVVCQCGATS